MTIFIWIDGTGENLRGLLKLDKQKEPIHQFIYSLLLCSRTQIPDYRTNLSFDKLIILNNLETNHVFEIERSSKMESLLADIHHIIFFNLFNLFVADCYSSGNIGIALYSLSATFVPVNDSHWIDLR